MRKKINCDLVNNTTNGCVLSPRNLSLKLGAIAWVFALLTTSANAQALQSALKTTTWSGSFGLRNFDYINRSHTRYDHHAFGVGGHLIIHTGSLYGFSVGFGGYTGQSLGIYNDFLGSNELTGPNHGLQSFRQAYLQYQSGPINVRFGRQLIQTPYANEDYYTFMPRSFMGIAGVANIIGKNDDGVDSGPLDLSGSTDKLSVFAARMFTYAGRYNSPFTTGNRYTSAATNGFLTIGVRYQDDFLGTHIMAQGWYYNFYNFAQLLYGEAELSRHFTKTDSLFGAVQIVSEGNSSGDGVALFTNGNADSVDAHIYGAKLGVKFGTDRVALVGDYSPVAYNSFRHGGLVHPYNDLSGTEFTATMQTDLSDLGPGYAYGITSNFRFIHKKLDIGADFIRYDARYGYGGSTYTYSGPYGFPTGTAIPNEKLWALQVGASYNLSSILNGLYVADDTDIETAQNATNIGPYHNPYFSNRFFLMYRF